MSVQPSKTVQQIEAMRVGGKILASILHDLRDFVQVGVTGLEVDAWVGEQIAARGASATYRTAEVNFPGNIVIAINDAVVHSIPTSYAFEKGDVVSFDLVITYDHMKTDSAFTMVVGEAPTGAVKHLLKFTERSLYAGIDAIKGPVRTGDIGAAIEQVLVGAKLGVVRELVGHGVGQQMHMAPEVLNYGQRGSGILLEPGDTIAIEPMATLGSERVVNGDDGWTYRTADGSLAAHFEHTVLITETGADILTRLE